jgi:hypothetical protein
MKLLLTLLLSVFITTTTSAALSAPAVAPVTVEVVAPTFDRKAIEAQLGRKLNFAERIVFGVAERKAKRRAQAGVRNGPVDALAVVSFGLGLLSIITTFVGGGGLFVLFGLGAIVTGVISLIKLSGKQDYKGGRGFAIAGIAIPIGWLLLLVLLVLALFNGF